MITGIEVALQFSKNARRNLYCGHEEVNRMKTRFKRRGWFLANQFLSILLLATTAVRADSTADTNSIQSLKRMSLDDLMNVEITSVSKKEEKLSEAPAAVYVLTQEDIHRSGATCIPEALRLVPGLDVARIDAHTWAISSRGFNNEFANKLLVLIDGRNVYTPLFSGVFWDVQDPMLEDVDRIEVIRGPGATM